MVNIYLNDAAFITYFLFLERKRGKTSAHCHPCVRCIFIVTVGVLKHVGVSEPQITCEAIYVSPLNRIRIL